MVRAIRPRLCCRGPAALLGRAADRPARCQTGLRRLLRLKRWRLAGHHGQFVADHGAHAGQQFARAVGQVLGQELAVAAAQKSKWRPGAASISARVYASRGR